MPNLRENMTPAPATIAWDASMEAAKIKMEALRVRHLPVTDYDRTVIGILSDRDIKRALDPQRAEFVQGALVRDFMSWPVITARETEPLRTIVKAMVNEKISAVLVTGPNDQLQGIITSEDLLRLLLSYLPEKEAATIDRIAYFPLVGEFLREAQAAGI